MESIGKSSAALRATYPALSVERARNGAVLDPADGLLLERDDQVTIYGQIRRSSRPAPRSARDLRTRRADIGAQTVDRSSFSKEVAGRRLADLAMDVTGVYINGMFHAGEAVLFGLMIQAGDVLRVLPVATSTEREVEVVAALRCQHRHRHAGRSANGGRVVDALPGRRVTLTLTASVGLLLVGIALSTLRTRAPAFGGPFPEPARRLLEDLGLNVFVAILGVNAAGAGCWSMAFWGWSVPSCSGASSSRSSSPKICWFVGTRLWNTALLLGAVAGGCCNSPGMRVATEVSESDVPAISYPVTFAISNVILTLMSYVLAVSKTGAAC